MCRAFVIVGSVLNQFNSFLTCHVIDGDVNDGNVINLLLGFFSTFLMKIRSKFFN